MIDKLDINFKSLIANRRYLLLTGVSVLIGLLLVFNGIIPQVNSLFELRRQINVDREKTSILRQKTIDLENIEAQEAYGSLELVDKVLPSKKPLLELLTSLDVVASQNNVIFVDLSLSPGKISSESAQFLGVAKSNSKKKKALPKKNLDGYDSLVVEAEIFGLFSNVQKFFQDIERVAPLITITSLSLDIKSSDIIRPTDEVQAEIVLSTYFFTQSVTANLSSPLPNIGSKEQAIITEIKGYSFPTFNAQQQIKGGGLEDLFGLNLPNF